MSYSLSDLLTRTLHDVFGESNPTRRSNAINELFAEDAAFYRPDGVVRGRDGIDRVAGEIRATHPEYQYTVLGLPGNLQGAAGRIVGFRVARERGLLTPAPISSSLPMPDRSDLSLFRSPARMTRA